jgi:hypothetical protein
MQKKERELRLKR